MGLIAERLIKYASNLHGILPSDLYCKIILQKKTRQLPSFLVFATEKYHITVYNSASCQFLSLLLSFSNA